MTIFPLARYRDTSVSMCDYAPLSQRDLNDSEEELFPCNAASASVRLGQCLSHNIYMSDRFVASSCSRREYLRQCVNLDRVIAPTPLSSLVAGHAVLAFSGLCVPLSLVLGLDTSGPRTLALVLLLLTMATLLLVTILIYTIPN